jgi:hypothetical protein
MLALDNSLSQRLDGHSEATDFVVTVLKRRHGPCVVAGNAAGLMTALVRRGPWGHLWADDVLVRRTANWVVNSLADLPALIGPPAAERRESA